MGFVKTFDDPKAAQIFYANHKSVVRKTNVNFRNLLIVQWLLAIVIAFTVSPLLWEPNHNAATACQQIAAFGGFVLCAVPILLMKLYPDAMMNRFVVAIAQMLFSTLLIHITKGRPETHFHIFGSLAFLVFYRDWRVILVASAIAVTDHFVRGLYIPESIYGTATANPWRVTEFTWWMFFEDVFLIYSVRSSRQEMRALSQQQLQYQETIASIEQAIAERTDAFQKEARYVRLLNQMANAASGSQSTTDAFQMALQLICDRLGFKLGHVLKRERTSNGAMISTRIWYQNALRPLTEFKETSANIQFLPGMDLPGMVLESKQAQWSPDVSQSHQGPRHSAASICHLKAGVAIPIFLKDRKTVGFVMEFFTDKAAAEDRQLMDVLNSIGMQLGRVVERVIAQEELANRERALFESQKVIAKQDFALVAAARTSALGEMAGQIAHEINTPLGAIVLTAESLRKKAESGDLNATLFKQQLDLILKVTEKLTRIISSMRKLAGHGGNDAISEISVKTLIDDTLLLCEGRFKKVGIPFEVQLGEIEQRRLQCMPNQISQILINLLNNAHDAICGQEERWIKVMAGESDGVLRIEVIDSGKGVPREVQEKLFTPNFTTKSLNQGTGFGLSISRRIAERHRGKLYLDVENRNTCFVLELPFEQTQDLLKTIKAA